MTEKVNINIDADYWQEAMEASDEIFGSKKSTAIVQMALQKYLESGYDDEDTLSDYYNCYDRSLDELTTVSKNTRTVRRSVTLPDGLYQELRSEAKTKGYKKPRISDAVERALIVFIYARKIRDEVIQEHVKEAEDADVNQLVKNNYNADVTLGELEDARIKNSKKYRIPALVSALKNHDFNDYTEDSLQDHIQDIYSCSQATVTNYLNELARQKYGNIIRYCQVEGISHPSYHPDRFRYFVFKEEHLDNYYAYIANRTHKQLSDTRSSEYISSGKSYKDWESLAEATLNVIDSIEADIPDELRENLKQHV
jgi:hypothetical protein